MAWKTKKLASRTFIHDRHVLKGNRSALSIKDENADDTVFQMICKNVFLNLISFARFCSSLIFIFSIIRTLDYPDYFVWSHYVFFFLSFPFLSFLNLLLLNYFMFKCPLPASTSCAICKQRNLLCNFCERIKLTN